MQRESEISSFETWCIAMAQVLASNRALEQVKIGTWDCRAVVFFLQWPS